MFSNRIITNMNADMPDNKKLQANFCTQLIGFIALIASFFSSYTTQKFKRRSGFIFG
jgi:hypothetical protein